MHGFSGPFEFDLDTEGTVVGWDKLDKHIRSDLSTDGQFTEKNSKVYFLKTAVRSTERTLEKHHDWKKVNRLCIQADTPAKGISICGIYPRDKRVRDIPQTELGYIPSIKGSAKLFNSLEFKIDLSSFAKLLSRSDRYAVISAYTKRFAQWIYSPGWDGVDFAMYLYAAVLNELPPEQKYLQISVKPLRKGNKVLSQAAIWKRPVVLQ